MVLSASITTISTTSSNVRWLLVSLLFLHSSSQADIMAHLNPDHHSQWSSHKQSRHLEGNVRYQFGHYDDSSRSTSQTTAVSVKMTMTDRPLDEESGASFPDCRSNSKKRCDTPSVSPSVSSSQSKAADPSFASLSSFIPSPSEADNEGITSWIVRANGTNEPSSDENNIPKWNGSLEPSVAIATYQEDDSRLPPPTSGPLGQGTYAPSVTTATSTVPVPIFEHGPTAPVVLTKTMQPSSAIPESSLSPRTFADVSLRPSQTPSSAPSELVGRDTSDIPTEVASDYEHAAASEIPTILDPSPPFTYYPFVITFPPPTEKYSRFGSGPLKSNPIDPNLSDKGQSRNSVKTAVVISALIGIGLVGAYMMFGATDEIYDDGDNGTDIAERDEDTASVFSV
mmetsp:Transcript_7686/g.12181  ORF Transcript_7686/g.12181 Transcript_7686/m.12181 type:complete len:397 (+) Transcript_7686:152-1342(+)